MSDHPNQRRRILRGSSSSGSNREEDIEIVQTTFNDLPDDLIQTIMLHGAASFRDFVRSRAMMTRMRDLSDQDAFLANVDLYSMKTPWVPDHTGLTNFRLLCQHSGNKSALLLQGCSEFFFHSNFENGMALIRESAVRGYELGIYVYSMMKRIMSPDDGLDRELINPNRNLISRMRKIVDDAEIRVWATTPIPELFLERVNNLDLGFLTRHRCASFDHWFRIWNESYKGREMCDVCFYTIHCLGFKREFLKTMIFWPLRYYF